ncbi:hypothetical protein CVT24_001296 [Panaeolus cyanescens]|uniref:F-box domain-containing protein n=1 Tax=Panaeolus cyanescens TaxID=181874 RepID=A0A409YZ04_9AGAR|nr:hypothetical protein CVT24_001296 [Panaeolus cyanescens]
MQSIRSRQPVIPLDIFDQIVHHAALFTDAEDRRKTLASLGLLCRWFAHLCRKQRLRKVSIHACSRDGCKIFPGGSQLISLFWEQTELPRSFIRELAWHGGWYDGTDDELPFAWILDLRIEDSVRRAVRLGMNIKYLKLDNVTNGVKLKPGMTTEETLHPLFVYCEGLEELDVSFPIGNWQQRKALSTSLPWKSCKAVLFDGTARMVPNGLMTKLHTIKSTGSGNWNVLCRLADTLGVEGFSSLKTVQFSSFLQPYSVEMAGPARPRGFNAIMKHAKTLENLILGLSNYQCADNIDLKTCTNNNHLTLKTISISWEIPTIVGDDRPLEVLCNALADVQGNNVIEKITLTTNLSPKLGMMIPSAYFNSWKRLDTLIMKDAPTYFPLLRQLDIHIKFSSAAAQMYLDQHQDSSGVPVFINSSFPHSLEILGAKVHPIKCKIIIEGEQGQEVAHY